MPPSAKSHFLASIDEEDGVSGGGQGGGIEVTEYGSILFTNPTSCNALSVPGGDACDGTEAFETLNAFAGFSLADQEDDPLPEMAVVRSEEEEGEESIEAPFGFVNLFDTLLYGCVGCEPCVGTYSKRPRQGILKKDNGTSNKQNDSGTGLSVRSVSFSSCDIKTFNMTLGNNPCAVSGPPVMLDWESKPTFERVMSLDEYERNRTPRRKRSQLKLSYRDRKGILEGQQGFTSEEVNRAWAEAIQIRKQRHETLQRGVLMNTFDDAWESAQRKCHRVAEAVGIA